MSKERFAELLKHYLDDTITPEQRAELMELIRQGGYEAELRKSVEASMINDTDVTDMDASVGDEIARNILDSQARDKKIIPLRTWHWAAAAAVIVLCVSGLWLFNQRASVEQQVADVKTEPTNNQLAIQTTTYTGKQLITLADGSTVMLDDNSKLTHTVDFNGTLREVSVEGKAYFDIAHNPDKPFKAHIGDYVITVLGTAFNVDAPAGVKQVKVTVTRGKVAVGKGKEVYELLTPNQEIAINTNNDTYDTHRVNAEEVVAWQKDYFVLNNVTMQQAAEEVGERFGVTIEIENKELTSCKVSARFIYHETLDEVLAFITGPREAEFEYVGTQNVASGKKIVIKGGNGCGNE